MNDQPSDLLLAIAEAIIAHHGGFCVSKDLYEEIVAVTTRMKAGTATAAEIELIEQSLAQVPGYSQWQSRQLLARALRGRKKAFV
jgi:hypothetical protein